MTDDTEISAKLAGLRVLNPNAETNATVVTGRVARRRSNRRIAASIPVVALVVVASMLVVNRGDGDQTVASGEGETPETSATSSSTSLQETTSTIGGAGEPTASSRGDGNTVR